VHDLVWHALSLDGAEQVRHSLVDPNSMGPDPATRSSRHVDIKGALDSNAKLTRELCDILVNFDRRMGRLEEAILPVQVCV